MNTVWSTHVQGINTLYLSRKLRFDDVFAQRYKPFFALDESRPIKILEIGCGPGAMAGALRRWYPKSKITAIDRDSEFIRFAKENEPGINFIEADADKLPFDDSEFDAVISYTVSEHIDPSVFYLQQRRVLKSGGICLVLSSRKGINITAPCLKDDDFEKAFWENVSGFDDAMEKYSVGKYAMTESEMPKIMEEYGFTHVSTGYAAIDLTPDDPKYDIGMSMAMINAVREMNLENIRTVSKTMGEHFDASQIERMENNVNRKFDARIYDLVNGKKHWDTNLSLIMMLRGIKQ